MLDIAGDFHTHTVHSHGTGTIEDNVKAAIDRGLLAIAISDHGTGHMFYSIKDMDRYLHDIEDIREKYAGKIRVYSGYEGNLQSLDGQTDLLPSFAPSIDIPFFGYHKGVRYPDPKAFLHFMLPKSSSAAAREKNTKAYEAALRRYPEMRFISHPGYGLPVDIRALARAAKEAGTALEINGKHPEFTPDELRAAAQEGAAFIIGSDAHDPGRVGDFSRALEKAEQAGISPGQILNSRQNINAFVASLDARRRERARPEFRAVLEGARKGP